MKSAITLIFFMLFAQCAFTQNDWNEHLSHDRTAYAHHGHFLDFFGGIHLIMGNSIAPMNTTEAIKGNYKKSLLRKHSDINTYTNKSTRLGLNQNEVSLTAPWNYDVPGEGVHSIVQTSLQNINFREVPSISGEPLNITDILIPLFPFDEKYCVTDDDKWYGLDYENEINWDEAFDGTLALHYGLDGKAFKIYNGIISNIKDPNAATLDLGYYELIDNNPFADQLIEFDQAIVNRYSYQDFSLERSDMINGTPIDHLFVFNGFYFLIESDLDYSIYFFSDVTSQSELYYKLPKTEEIQDFEILEFNLKSDDIFFLGLLHDSHTNEKFSYVQKRNVGFDYEPERKDLELTDINVIANPTGQNDQMEYKYTCTVTNLSDEPINHFTLYSEKLESLDMASGQYIKNDVSQELGPGESMEIEGQFIYSPLNSLTFHIAGVDFAIDSDMNNNSFTANFNPLSNEDILSNEFNLAPNPSSAFIGIDGEIGKVQSLTIFDLIGHKIEIPTNQSNKIDISNLPNGQYWLQIQSSSNMERLAFIKN